MVVVERLVEVDTKKNFPFLRNRNKKNVMSGIMIFCREVWVVVLDAAIHLSA
jgi:hypothetical protein